MNSNLNNIPLNSLRFSAVAARHLHLSKAADELCVTYSAISHQIRSLKNVLGVPLFDRSRKPLIFPQNNGHALKPHFPV